jgi:hypothetical protein
LLDEVGLLCDEARFIVVRFLPIIVVDGRLEAAMIETGQCALKIRRALR